MRNQAARCRMCADRRSGTQRAHPGDLRGNTTSSILFGLASGAHLLPGGDVACADPVVVGGVQVQSAFFVDSHRPPHPCLWGADVGDAFESDLPASVGRDGLFAYFAHIFHPICSLHSSWTVTGPHTHAFGALTWVTPSSLISPRASGEMVCLHTSHTYSIRSAVCILRGQSPAPTPMPLGR